MGRIEDQNVVFFHSEKSPYKKRVMALTENKSVNASICWYTPQKWILNVNPQIILTLSSNELPTFIIQTS